MKTLTQLFCNGKEVTDIQITFFGFTQNNKTTENVVNFKCIFNFAAIHKLRNFFNNKTFLDIVSEGFFSNQQLQLSNCLIVGIETNVGVKEEREMRVTLVTRDTFTEKKRQPFIFR